MFFAQEVTKTESGNYNREGPVCREMDSIRGKVKEHTGGSGDVIQFGNGYQKPKNNYSFQLRTSP